MAKNDTLDLIFKILLIVGGLNWGLVGIGSFIGLNLNVVDLILGGIPVLERIVYIIVGISAIYMIYVMAKEK
jgi:uncharacterized protein